MVPTKNVLVMVKKGNKNTSQYWADEINVLWRKTAEAYVKMGQLLLEAKRSLKPSVWKDLLEDKLDFDQSKADKLMLIAKDPILTKTSHVKLLPPSYTTLYLLTQLDQKSLNTAFKKGDVHSNMERSDAKELVEKFKPKPPKPEPAHSRDAEDAEVIETEENKPEEKTIKSSKVKSSVVTPPNKVDLWDTALGNWEGSMDSFLEFSERLETAMEKKGIEQIPREYREKFRRLHAYISKFAEKYS